MTDRERAIEPRVVHGGLDEAELRALGVDPSGVLDLSANLHPAGTSAAVLRAAREVRLDRYAPVDAAPLRAAIAAHEGLAPEWVLPTPGATAAIHLVARTLLAAGDRAAVFAPTFGEYEAAIASVGGRALHLVSEAPRFEPPAPSAPAVPLGFLANPNNPTGTHLSRAEVERIAVGLGGTLVVDAAYEPFVAPVVGGSREGAWDAATLVRDGHDVLVIRSMTKLHAIPGVRLGYVLGQPELVARLAAQQHSWSLDAVAQAVGPVALGEHAARVELLPEVWATRERLRDALVGAGFVVGPSRANFLLVEVGDAGDARRRLLAEGLLARDCSSFGLPAWIRLAVPAAGDEARVREALLQLRPGPSR